MDSAKPTPVRIAYFIMVHHKPDQFEWLMNAIHDPNDLFLIHVDMKSRLGLKADRRHTMRRIKEICAGKPNVRLMRSRFTNWGGWSLSRTLIDAMREALRLDDRWTHFINLSGQCYPLRSMAEIRATLAAEAAGQVRVEMRPFDALPADDWHLKWHPMLETPLRAIILPGRKRSPSGFTLDSKGSQWVILPRAFCEWIVSTPMLAQIARYMRGLLLTDELIIQTLVANGPFRDRVAPHYGREIVWPGPKTMTTDDLPRLRASPALFGRKFDAASHPEVLEALATDAGFRRGPRTSEPSA